MDTNNNRSKANVDDILDELKSRGAPAPGTIGQNVDSILAEMGMGIKKTSPFDNVRPGAPMPPPIRSKPQVEEAVAPAKEAPPMAELPEEVPPTKEPVSLPAEDPHPPTPVKRKKSTTSTMIWDIELEHTDMGPRVGKAAALDKVDADKYVGDSELSRWFSEENTLPISKKDRKEAEKEKRRRLSAETRAEKQKDKKTAEPHDDEPVAPVVEEYPADDSLYEDDAPLAPSLVDDVDGEDLFSNGSTPEKTLSGFTPPNDFDFNDDLTPKKRKGFFARLFGGKDEPLEDEPLYDALPDDDEDFEEPAYQDSFSAAFGEEGADAPALDSPSSSKSLPDTPLQADTAAFAAAYQPQAAPGDPALPADTAAFAAAMQQGTSAPLSASDAADPKKENASSSDVEPNTAEFAAALGKAPLASAPRPKPEAPEAGAPLQKLADHAAAAFARDIAGELPAGKSDAQKELEHTMVWELPLPKKGDKAFDELAATGIFTARGPLPNASTEVFAAIKVEPITLEQPALKDWAAKDKKDTQPFDFSQGDEAERVPTAAFTQEFGSNGDPVPDDRSLFLDDMVDDRFRQFFSETVIVERDDELLDPKARKKRKKSRSAILTGEFARMAELAAQAELAEMTGETLPDEEVFDEYEHPKDAPAVEGDIAGLRTILTRRTVVTGAIALLLLWMALSFGGTLPLPTAISFAVNPYLFTGIYLALMLGAVIVNFTSVATGLVGLFAAPTVDSAPALAALGGLLQGTMLLVQVINKQPAQATLFGGVAALVLCFNALGKRIRTVSILRNFQLASAGMDHSAAYVLDSSNELSYNITKGLEEEDPTLLISRPTALVKGFMRQSFSQRNTDRTGRTLGWITLVAGLVSTALTLILGGLNIFSGVSAFAAVLCITAPFSSSLVSAVPSLLLQRATHRLGAVVPGWSAIEELGNVNVVMAGAKDIFPPSSVHLNGIKTFEKERIDVAILYAASVLIEGCDTLKDIFSGVIQGKNDMLYKVESLVAEPGRGFTAWVQNNRVVIGSREMLQKHDVTPPPIEIEIKYIPKGHMPVYLAVSGKLFAMFIVGYRADPEVRSTLNGLVKSGVSLLIKSDDMNVTNELIEHTYKLPHGAVKVLGRKELSIMDPLTSYTPDSEGVMTHIGSFTSFIGGMRSAAGCAASERMSSILQLASIILAGVLCMLLAFGGGLPTLSLSLALLYQAAWTSLVAIIPFMRRY